MIINITIKNTHKKILETQKLLLLELLNLLRIKTYTCKAFKVKLKKISLLKSPHIHKYTWRTYLFKTYNLILKIQTVNYSKLLPKLNLLLKILNKNSKIKIIYQQ